MIIRSYQCLDCNLMFEVELESGEDGDPDCPNCARILDWVPGMFAVKTDRSRAVDYTQKIIEEDFQLPNLNDGNREGDVAYKPPPPMQTAERETIEQAVREFVRESTQVPAGMAPPPPAGQPQIQAAVHNFWGAQPAGGMPGIPAAAALAGAKIGPQYPNPMATLQEGLKSGHLRTPVRILSRWRP
jgi:hypothetical protein